MIGMDFNTYSCYCTKVLEPVLQKYCVENSGVIVNSRHKEIIWEYYQEFNRHCKQHYMSNPSHLIDRHKVVACYMYAIEKDHVITVVQSLKDGDDSNLMLNERLSFCFGMTMLRSFIMNLIAYIDNDEKKDRAVKSFDNGFCFPECNHGDYKNNFLSQLYFTHRENNYNILSLANSLYFLEIFTLVKNNLPEDLLKSCIK